MIYWYVSLETKAILHVSYRNLRVVIFNGAARPSKHPFGMDKVHQLITAWHAVPALALRAENDTRRLGHQTRADSRWPFPKLAATGLKGRDSLVAARFSRFDSPGDKSPPFPPPNVVPRPHKLELEDQIQPIVCFSLALLPEHRLLLDQRNR